MLDKRLEVNCAHTLARQVGFSNQCFRWIRPSTISNDASKQSEEMTDLVLMIIGVGGQREAAVSAVRKGV